jgi:propanol-preferring alcohol dehydrogenase
MTLKAQVLRRSAPAESSPLELLEVPKPEPADREILVKVSTCGVCHTELDEIEGRLSPRLPIIPGHEIVGRVTARGKRARKYRIGDRVGIAWIHSSCGKCQFCRAGLENLCDNFQGTGCDTDGGYAEYTVVSEDFAYLIPATFNDAQAAPLLCAGAIGYRDLKLSGIKPGQKLGLFGFGASAHIVLQMAVHQGNEVYVFTRGNEHQRLAMKLGAKWTGTGEDSPPKKLDAAIDFTPVGETVPMVLKALEKGGRLIIAVIRKRTSIPAIDYASLLWNEREIKSVANITRHDISEFLLLAAKIPIMTEVVEFPLGQANQALVLLKEGKIKGAAVLKIGEGGLQ